MDQILRNFELDLERLPIDESAKRNVKTLAALHFKLINVEHQKVQKNCSEEKSRLDNASNSFQGKLLNISDEVEEMLKLSEIGIQELLLSQQWLNKSIEIFKQEYEEGGLNGREGIDKKALLEKVRQVRIDANRVLEALNEGLETKIHSNIALDQDNVNQLQELMRSFKNSTHAISSEISRVEHEKNKNSFDELDKYIKEAAENLDDLTKKVKIIQSDLIKKFKEETLKYDVYENRFKYLIGMKDSETAANIAKKVGEMIDKFTKTNHTRDGKLAMKDIRPTMFEMNNLWLQNYNDELNKERANLENDSFDYLDYLNTIQDLEENCKNMIEELEESQSSRKRLAENAKTRENEHRDQLAEAKEKVREMEEELVECKNALRRLAGRS